MRGTHHGLCAKQAFSLGNGRQLIPSPPEAGPLQGDELRRYSWSPDPMLAEVATSEGSGEEAQVFDLPCDGQVTELLIVP